VEKKQYTVTMMCSINNIETICNDMHKRGYEVISVVYDVVWEKYVIIGKLINIWRIEKYGYM